jgi:hypothetical protein
VPSLPEPIDLRVKHPVAAPGGRVPRPWQAAPRVRALLHRVLARCVPRRPRAAATATSALTALWDAWAFAELECAIALRAWRLAPRAEKRVPYAAYRRALEREALLAAELRLRSAA